MRILYISNSSNVSGAPAALLNLIEQLKDRHEMTVVLPDASGPLHKVLADMGVKCYCDLPYGLTIWPRVLNPIKYLRRIHELTAGLDKARSYVGKIIDEFHPDIVHTNVGPLDLALDECRKRGIPHVWHLREYQSGMRFWPSRRNFLGKVHSFGNRNIAITGCVHDYWRLSEKDPVIYDGVKPVDRKEPFNENPQPWFLYVGRIEKNKGLIELLKAFSLYRKAGGKAVLKIAGRPSLMYSLRCRLYARLAGLDPYVEFLGHCDDVRGLMENAMATVVSSRTEGFGLVAVEAMLAGCLVIGKDTTGMKEQFDIGLDHTGEEIGLRYDDVPELAALLSRVTEGYASFASMRERAFNTVVAKYRPEVGAAAVEEFYNDIMEGRI